MFQTKDFRSIVAGMINHLRGTTEQISDYNVGSVARSIVEAPAVEIDELYQQMANGLIESIPTAIYLAFGFDTLPATFAVGNIRFYLASAATQTYTIPAGTQVFVTGQPQGYLTTQAGILSVGQTQIDLPIQAEAVGAGFNAGANTITELAQAIGALQVTNPSPITTGADAETPADRKARFLDYVAALSRAPAFTIEYGATTAALRDTDGNITERVVTATVVEPYIADQTKPLGKIDCYIFNGATGASAALVTEAQKIIDGYVDGQTPITGYRAAGVICTVIAATITAVNVTIDVDLVAGYQLADVQTPVQNALSAYIGALGVGDELVVSELAAAALAVDGVYDCAVTAPSANQIGTLGAKYTPGTITVGAL